MGVTGGGKSYYLIKKYTDLVMNGIAASLIDPHGDLADDCLRLLIDRGYFKSPNAYKKLWYIDFTLKDRFIPFNILKQPFAHYTIGRNIAEAMKRAYPANLGGEGSAPVFTDMSQFTSIVLSSNNLPITEATRLLAHKDYREKLLENTPHPQTQEYFHDRFDRWDKRDQASKVESFLNKLSDLTITDPMFNALSQTENILDFQKHINEGRSLIFNIHVDDEETKRLLGCLLTVGFERAALTRTTNRSLYHLLIDEFSSFSTADGKTESSLLSQARKFNFILTLAHQTIGQLSESMISSVQNMALETFFALGYDDAQLVAPRIGHYRETEIKDEVKDEEAQKRIHPVFTNMPEQWERLARKLENLHRQQAYVKIKQVLPRWKQFFFQPHKTFKMRSCTIPKQVCTNAEIQRVKDYYAQTLTKPIQSIQDTPKPMQTFIPVRKRRSLVR